MAVRPIYAASFLIASLGALTVSAQNANLTPLLADYLLLPTDAYYEGPVTLAQTDDTVPMIQPEDTAPPSMLPSDTTPAPVSDDSTKPPYAAEPPINVTITPEDRDTLINNDVVNALSTDPRLSGKIGVETYRQVVTLTGRVTDPLQAEHAGQIARGVTDVNEVQNLIRARVGG
jgi:hypothetical protein